MPSRIEAAMVLAAGRGERLRPLTDETPKPLIEVDGVCLLDRILTHLRPLEIPNTVVNAHHLADRLEQHLGGLDHPGLILSHETEPLETGGGVMAARAHLQDTDGFLVINGDSLWIDGPRPVLEKLVAAWDPETMDILLLVYPFARVLGFHGRGDFDMGPLGRLNRRTESHIAPFAYIGVSILHPRILEGAPEGSFSLNQLYDRAQAKERLYGMVHDGLWYHISTERDLAQARRRFENDHLSDHPFF
jgi:MurNAc alpha-1-phosphate uridylyltransferase